MLKDTHAWDRPLLMIMADPNLAFYQGLAQFKHLALLANAHHDHMVPYRTAAIVAQDPYEGRHTAPAHDPVTFPSVVRPSDDTGEVKEVAGRWVPYVALALLPLLFPVVLVVLAVMTWQGRQHYTSLSKQGLPQPWLLEADGTARSKSVQGSAAGDVEQGSDSGDVDTADPSGILLQDAKSSKPGSAAVSGAASVLEKQLWVVERLNQLPWNKVDVDAGHGHAHAAIVLRTPTRFKNRDHLHYLFAHMQW